eukprot:maker-scaffold624_size122968-snap-gene-0.15 protein:Tk09511 transcript:maker-scaffold624_size122968-snap-gene-0.15-mRNA-1 annotation:"hypothetical protein THAOC_23143"
MSKNSEYRVPPPLELDEIERATEHLIRQSQIEDYQVVKFSLATCAENMEGKECVALQAVLEYLKIRIGGDVEALAKILHKEISPKCREYLERATRTTEYQVIAQNVSTVRPQLGEKSVAVTLEYRVSRDSPDIGSEVIDIDEDGQIIDVEALDLKPEDLSRAQKLTVGRTKLTPFDLFNVIIPFALADAKVDMDFHEPHLDEDVEAYGLGGKVDVLKAKDVFLSPQKGQGPAYKFGDFKVDDLEEPQVSFRYECLIPSKEGSGTEIMTMNEAKKIVKISAVRD